MNNAPSGLPECTSTSISLDTQTALCAFIAATNVGSQYAQWQCNAYGEVVTQPCDGATPIWSGVSNCSSFGEIKSIWMDSTGSNALTGKRVHDENDYDGDRNNDDDHDNDDDGKSNVM